MELCSPLFNIDTPPPVSDRVTPLWQCAGELHSCNALIRQLYPQMSVPSVYTHVMSGPDAVSMSAPGSYHAVIAIPQLWGLRLCNCTGEFCPTMTMLCIFVLCNIYPVSSVSIPGRCAPKVLVLKIMSVWCLHGVGGCAWNGGAFCNVSPTSPA